MDVTGTCTQPIVIIMMVFCDDHSCRWCYRPSLGSRIEENGSKECAARTAVVGLDQHHPPAGLGLIMPQPWHHAPSNIQSGPAIRGIPLALLLQCDDDKLDFSGDIGAVGRAKVRLQYQTTPYATAVAYSTAQCMREPAQTYTGRFVFLFRMRASCQVDKESEQLFLDLRGFMCAAAPQYLAEHPGSTR
jgi:hypothetical protein